MLSQERVFRFAVLGTGRGGGGGGGGGVNMLSQECVFSAYRLAVVERGCIRVYVCVVCVLCVCVLCFVLCAVLPRYGLQPISSISHGFNFNLKTIHCEVMAA